MLRLHGVFLAIAVLTLGWNLAAQRRSTAAAPRAAWIDRWLLVPLLLGLAWVLVADRVAPEAPTLLGHPAVAAAFPLAYLLAAAQNTFVLVGRGARLSDIPLVLFNVGMGAVVGISAMALHGWPSGYHEARLLYEGSVIQGLMGTRLSHVWTLSWPLPFLLLRAPPRTLLGLVAGLLPAAIAGLAVLLLVMLTGPAGRVVAAFDVEPRIQQLRPDLGLGIATRADVPSDGAPAPPGDMQVWKLPAGHHGTGLLPERDPDRPLVVEVLFPSAWYAEPPAPELRDPVLLEGAVRLAAALRPDVLLPLPEPDGAGTLHFGSDMNAERWRELFGGIRAAVHDVSPDTRIGVRLAGTGRLSQLLFDALVDAPAVVDVAGPRIEPGGISPGQGDHAQDVLATWSRWRDGLTDPPELWILSLAASPLAFGESAQARFVEGVIARASGDPAVAAVLLAGWRDLGHTQGLVRPDGSPRAALTTIERLLASPRVAPSR